MVTPDGGSYDLVVIGGGLAGLTAGLFGARYGRATLVLEATVPGGHLINVEKIEDFPGFPEGIAGYDLCPTVHEQAERAGAQFALAAVERLAAAGGSWRVVTAQGEHLARAVIVASGMRPKPLGVPGEAALLGRGVSHCATCDGPLFRGQVVGVAGGGDHALQEALTLAGHAARVLVLNPGPSFTGQETYRRRVAEHATIQVRHQVAVEEVLGEGAVAGVRVRDTGSGAAGQIELKGLFVYAGLEPNTGFLGDLLRLAADGRVPTDAGLRTAQPGVFAAGDVRQEGAGHAITAAGDGAAAAIAAHRYLEGLAQANP
jgi:thioredoxin reductase (NADPH)